MPRAVGVTDNDMSATTYNNPHAARHRAPHARCRRLLGLCRVAAAVAMAMVLSPLCRAATLDARNVLRSYTTAEGLSDNTVNCGLRDRYGFLWLGTSNGLNCFDGVSSIVYRNFNTGSKSYGNNVVMSLLEHGDDLFVGGTVGLYVFNRADNRFSRFSVATEYGVVVSSQVQDMMLTRGGQVWVCTLGQGVFVYSPSTGRLVQDSRNGGFACGAAQGDDGNVYVANIDGRVNVFTQSGRHVRSFHIPGYVNDKNRLGVYCLNGGIWVATDAGLYRLDSRRGTFDRYATPAIAGPINGMVSENSRSLLLATSAGLYRFDTVALQFSRLDGGDGISGLADQNLNGLLLDRDGTLWLMTNRAGLCCLPKRPVFARFISLPDVGYGEKSLVTSFCPGDGDAAFVGTTGGLYRYSLRSGTLQRFGNIGNVAVTSLMADGGTLWVGTEQNGVKTIDLATGRVKSFVYSEKLPYTVTSNTIRCIFKNRAGRIYVATNWGICRFDRSSEHFLPFRILNSMTDYVSLCEDRSGCLWAASGNRGAFRYWPKSDEIDSYACDSRNPNSITSNSLRSVMCDSRGRVWLATKGGGLCRYDNASSGFTRIQGIDDNVHFVAEDRRRNIWAATDAGLVKIVGGRGDAVVQIASQADLWQGHLMQTATLNLADGQMLLGSENGFYCINPDRLTAVRQHAPVYVVSVSLPYVADSKSELRNIGLDRLLYVTRKVTLPYRDNSFTLHFSSPRAAASRGVRYEYMLQGFDRQWAHGTDNREATYANVPPGHYRFVLCEAGDRNNVTAIDVEVLPPWYRTTLAYLLYVLAAVGLAWLAARRARRVLRRRYDERLDRMRRDQEKRSFEEKIRFFVNLVHEIRTPLSLISLPLERLEQTKRSDTDRRYMEVIRRNMNYLLGITNQLLDFQKLESGTKQLCKTDTSVKELLQDVCYYFEAYGDLERKRVETDLPDEDIVTAIDRDCIKKILMNLMSNALKYARTRIVISMADTGDGHLAVRVSDDGPGIPDAEKTRIFESYYQVGGDRIASMLGTGLGLAYAKTLATAHGGQLSVSDAPGGGSCFELLLPVERVGSAPAEDEAVAEPAVVENESAAAADGKTRSFSVLVVEDNAELLSMMCEAMHDWYRVLRASNGVEALNVLAGETVDVVVSDVMMPVMDGIELCRRIKGDMIYSHIPVILLTAKTTIEAKVEGMENGADVYMEKPFSMQQLHLQINNLLRMRQEFHKRMLELDGDVAAVQPSEYGLTRQNLQFVEGVQRILNENMGDEGFSIDSMAGMMNMSRSSFYRKLKSLTGQSPVDFLKVQRIKRAAALLPEGYSVAEVSVKVGFSSASYFTKCFKQHYGMLPKVYVKEWQARNATAEAGQDGC